MGNHNQTGEGIVQKHPGSKSGNRNFKEIAKEDNPGDGKLRKESGMQVSPTEYKR